MLTPRLLHARLLPMGQQIDPLSNILAVCFSLLGGVSSDQSNCITMKMGREPVDGIAMIWLVKETGVLPSGRED
jgi:hypothetical protein